MKALVRDVVHHQGRSIAFKSDLMFVAVVFVTLAERRIQPLIQTGLGVADSLGSSQFGQSRLRKQADGDEAQGLPNITRAAKRRTEEKGTAPGLSEIAAIIDPEQNRLARDHGCRARDSDLREVDPPFAHVSRQAMPDRTGVGLGVQTPLIYCPWEPEYLTNCREAAEAFGREINTHTRKRDLPRPCCVEPGYIENEMMDLRSNCVQNPPGAGAGGEGKPLEDKPLGR